MKNSFDKKQLRLRDILLGLQYRYNLHNEGHKYLFQENVLTEEDPFFPEGAKWVFAVCLDPEKLELSEVLSGPLERCYLERLKKQIAETKTKAIRNFCQRQKILLPEGNLDYRILETLIPNNKQILNCEDAEEFPRLIVYQKDNKIFGRIAILVQKAEQFSAIPTKITVFDTDPASVELMEQSCYATLVIENMHWDIFLAEKFSKKGIRTVPKESVQGFKKTILEAGDIFKESIRCVPILGRQLVYSDTWGTNLFLIPKELLNSLVLDFEEVLFASKLSQVIRSRRILKVSFPPKAQNKFEQNLLNKLLSNVPSEQIATELALSETGGKENNLFKNINDGFENFDLYDENLPVFALVLDIRKFASFEEPQNISKEILERFEIQPVKTRDVSTLCFPVIRVTIGVEPVFPVVKHDGQVFLWLSNRTYKDIEKMLIYQVTQDFPETSFNVQRDVGNLVKEFWGNNVF